MTYDNPKSKSKGNIMAIQYLIASPLVKLFTDPKQFKSMFFGSIYIGNVDQDPLHPLHQQQVYVVDEHNNKIPVAQPIKIGSGGYAEYNGHPAKFVCDNPYSIVVLDKVGAEKWRIPDIRTIDNSTTSIDAIYRRQTTVAEIASGVFQTLPSYFTLTDRGNAPFNLVSGGVPDGYGVLDAGNGNTAILDDSVNTTYVSFFGAKGDYETNDQPAIDAALKWADEHNKSLYFSDGVYGYVGSMVIPKSVKILGTAACDMQPAPLEGDDKRLMREGFKHLIKGSNIIFKGAANKTETTPRSDRFNSFSYAVMLQEDSPDVIRNIGIIMDMDVLDADGRYTNPLADNRSDYDVGLYIKDSGHHRIYGVTVFGYWKKAGLLVSTQGIGVNPDYNFFSMCSFTGDVGVALLGNSDTAGGTEGLSGSTFSQCKIYDRNHHYRATTSLADLGTNAIFIDGKIDENNNISGHKFIGCEIRTVVEVPINLDHCQSFALIGCTTEMTNHHLTPGVKYIVGTSETFEVVISGVRMHSWHLQLRRLATQISGSLVIDDDSAGTSYFFRGGMGVRYGVPKEINAPFLAMSRNPIAGATQEWNLRYNDNGDLNFNFNNKSVLSLKQNGNVVSAGRLIGAQSIGGRIRENILNGEITIKGNSSYLALAGEGDAPDTLTNILGGEIGDILYLTPFSASVAITIVSNSSIRLTGRVTAMLDSVEDTLILYRSANGWWQEVSRNF